MSLADKVDLIAMVASLYDLNPEHTIIPTDAAVALAVEVTGLTVPQAVFAIKQHLEAREEWLPYREWDGRWKP